MKTWKIEGAEAIRIAERDGVTLHKYADPTEGYRSGLSVTEAREIAKEDASLIYCLVTPSGWTGDATGYNVADYFPGSLKGEARSGAKYLGPDSDGIEPTWSDGMDTDKIVAHVASASQDDRQEMAAGKWDEVMTDALYAACGAGSVEEMAEARQVAQAAARDACE